MVRAIALGVAAFHGIRSAWSFKCESDMNSVKVTKPEQKGLAIDDTTYHWCSDKIPSVWPNTEEPVRTIRTFKSWEIDWPDFNRETARDNLVDYIMTNDVRVLFGVGVTCNKTDDALDWERTKAVMNKIGPKHIMGLAIGNEQDLLYTKDYIQPFPDCIKDMWDGGYMWNATVSRIADFDAMNPEHKDIPVTSVISNAALSSGSQPFKEDNDAMVTTYLTEAFNKYGKRWVWTFNVYTFWNPSYRPDFPWFTGKCHRAIAAATSWESGYDLQETFKEIRRRIHKVTRKWDDKLWIGETGWSSPSPASFPSLAAKYCPAFVSKNTYRKFYENYMKYDLTLGSNTLDDFVGPDHVFYFTVRNAGQFGLAEHFGLMEGGPDPTKQCDYDACKLQAEDFVDNPSEESSSASSNDVVV